MDHNSGKKLINSKVLRYRNSGKLVVHGGHGYYLDLGKDYQFIGRKPHKISPATELEETDWYVEFEREDDPKEFNWSYVRAYSVHDLPKADKNDTSLPVEKRVNISPSELFNADESAYIQDYKTPGSWKFRLIVSAILSSIAYFINETFGAIVLCVGLFFTIKQFFREEQEKEEVASFNKGVDARKKEVLEAKNRVRNFRRSSIERVLNDFSAWEQMDGVTFEYATGDLFRKKGYTVEYTSTSNDGGIDLILVKDSERVGVQCKAYNKNVGIAAVRELRGIKSHWSDLDRFILVGLHGFTKQAREFADQYDIELFSIERDQFKIG